jgi:hypothetical protein
LWVQVLPTSGNNFVFRERILAGKDPYFTDRIFHPVGTSLLLHTNTEIDSVLGLILSPVLNEVGQMNVGLLLSGFLTAIGTYLLTLRLTGSFAGALFAGIAFAFCPFRITRYFAHINFALTQMIPFSLWAFFRMADTGKIRYGILTGLFFALTYYSNQYYMMFLIISFTFMLVYGFLKIPEWREKAFLKSLCMSGVVAAVLLAQIGWHFIQDRKDKVIAPHSGQEGIAVMGSAHLSDYVIPGPMAGLAGEILRDRYEGPHSKTTTGILTLLLATAGMVIAIKERKHALILMGLLGVLFLLITLGPYYSVGNFLIPLPYLIIRAVPYMNHVRLPYRAAPMVALAFSVMAGFGISFLTRSKRPWLHGLVALLFCALIFELWQVPLTVKKFYVPEVYYRIQKMENGSMLTLPFYNNVANAAHQMKYQIVHKKDLLNGRTARSTPLILQQSYLETIPIARSFDIVTRRRNKKGILNDVEVDSKVAGTFRQFFNVRYLAIHDRFTVEEDVKKYVATVFPDANLLSEEPGVRVYELPKLNEPRVIVPDKWSLRFFLFSGWKRGFKKVAIGLENEEKLVLPTIDKNQKLFMIMRIRSRKPMVSDMTALFKIRDKTIAELPLAKKYMRISLSISGTQIVEGRNLLRIELVDSRSQMLEFKGDSTAKFDLQIVRVSKD